MSQNREVVALFGFLWWLASGAAQLLRSPSDPLIQCAAHQAPSSLPTCPDCRSTAFRVRVTDFLAEVAEIHMVLDKLAAQSEGNTFLVNQEVVKWPEMGMLLRVAPTCWKISLDSYEPTCQCRYAPALEFCERYSHGKNIKLDGDSTMHYILEVLEYQCPNNFSAPVVDPATPQVLLWNRGLHMLNEPNDWGHTPQAYEAEIRSGATRIRQYSRDRRKLRGILMGSNYVCTSAFRDTYLNIIKQELNNNTKPALRMELFRTDGTTFLDTVLWKIVREFNMMEEDILDGYAITYRRCTLTPIRDGRHFLPLVPVKVFLLRNFNLYQSFEG
eukprot:gb/GEZN01011165.1/.p1 GENE.gb/GEZN01011165.1/~~gb/GEZN01011165.1/.p1  ORF type:complete len:337 (+),score=37.41 gb/GEZN01011165.1/:25-1011(+)